MNALQLGESLRAFGELVRSADGSERDLTALADALAEAGDCSVGKVVTKVSSYWKATGRTARFPASLRHQLSTIQAALERSTATVPAKDYAALLKLLVGEATIGGPAFADEVSLAIRNPIPAKPKKVKLAALDVRALADRLTSLSVDNAAFDAEIAAIEADRQLSKSKLQPVAELFLGYKRAFKSKTEIIAALRTRQLQDAIQGSRERRGEKIAV